MAEINIIATCAECGADLDITEEEDSSTRYSAKVNIKVSPCERCMDGKYNDGYTEGQEATND